MSIKSVCNLLVTASYVLLREMKFPFQKIEIRLCGTLLEKVQNILLITATVYLLLRMRYLDMVVNILH